ncbi:MAG: hypothetical protein ACYC2T_02250 [Bacillota bacterium]
MHRAANINDLVKEKDATEFFALDQAVLINNFREANSTREISIGHNIRDMQKEGISLSTAKIFINWHGQSTVQDSNGKCPVPRVGLRCDRHERTYP